MFMGKHSLQDNRMIQKSKPSEIDFNSEFQRAMALMEDTQKNILLTGRAGTEIDTP